MGKTKAYQNYEKAVYNWLVMNMPQVKAAREYAKGLGEGVFHVDATFNMLRKSVVCLNGKPKRNDTSNRLKALHDMLSSIILGIDDSYFWSGSFSKQVIEEGPEYVSLVLKIRAI